MSLVVYCLHARECLLYLWGENVCCAQTDRVLFSIPLERISVTTSVAACFYPEDGKFVSFSAGIPRLRTRTDPVIRFTYQMMDRSKTLLMVSVIRRHNFPLELLHAYDLHYSFPGCLIFCCKDHIHCVKSVYGNFPA